MKPRTIKLTAGALAASATTATSASAAIVVFDINPDIQLRSLSMIQSNFDGNALALNGINLVTGGFSATKVDGLNSAYLSTFYSQFAFGAISYYGYRLTVFSGGIYAGGSPLIATQLFVSGDTIGSLSNWTSRATAGADLPTGTFYIGLRLNGTYAGDANYGWLEVTHSNTGDLMTRFAFNDVAGQSISAGSTVSAPVPEASTLGFAGGLFGLVAAAHLRRRQQKQAAASDKFLALAAGEKLN